MKKTKQDLDKLKPGDKISATLKCHSNDTLTVVAILTLGEDGFYVEGGPDELSNNWYIHEFEIIK